MKAFVQTAVGEYSERELERPRSGPGEVILRVGAALTCGTDLKLLARGHPRIALPVTMGHEVCGEISEVGEGVNGWKVGDRAVPGISGPCGKCVDCSAGAGCPTREIRFRFFWSRAWIDVFPYFSNAARSRATASVRFPVSARACACTS